MDVSLLLFLRNAEEELILLWCVCKCPRPLLKGIKFMHNREKPVVHRDLKPGNVLISKDDSGNLRAKVADFGLSKMQQHSTAPLSSNPGSTWQYNPPEV